MDESITYLNIPKRQPSPGTSALPSLFIGRKYCSATGLIPANTHGICTDFVCTPDRGGFTELTDNNTSQHAFLWDSDCLPNLAGTTLHTPTGENIAVNANTPVLTNRFVITNTRLDKPSIKATNNEQHLSIQAEFDYAFTADQMDASLGALSLVETQCFLLLENGQQHSLLNTDEQAALFLSADNQSSAISPIIDASKSNDTLNQSWQINITHAIHDQLDGISVESLTVLEQYQTFFMQRELPFTDENIWTPVSTPISWGWSMRIARRYDGEWGIARQKLLMPTAGHNGMEMPSWESNTLASK